jgi:hypothetical protein
MSGKGKENENETQYTVEKVVAKRVRDGVVQYNVKWSGYDDDSNTWEVAENLDCPALIAAFEKNANRNPKVYQNDFDRRVVDRIIGLTEVNGERAFLIKWKKTMHAHLVPARIVNEKCPQIVIKFYEEHLCWDS